MSLRTSFIKQEEPKVRKRKSLTDDEKHIIDRLVDENILYRAIARVLNRHYVFKYHSTTLTMCATHTQKKQDEVLEKFEMKFMELNKVENQ